MWQLQGLKRVLMPLVVFTVVCFFSSVAWAETWRLFNFDSLVGSVPVIERQGEVYVAVGLMARSLKCEAKPMKEGLLIRKGSNRLQIVPNAAAAWLDYEILPLRNKPFVRSERWWMDSNSALLALQKLLSKSGEKALLTWKGGAVKADKTPKLELPKPAEKTYTPSPIARKYSVATDFRWGVYDDKVRAVLEFSGSLPPIGHGDKSIWVKSVSVKMTFPPSPEDNIRLSVDKKNDLCDIKLSSSTWRMQYFKLSEPGRLVVDFYRPYDETPSQKTEKKVTPVISPAPVRNRTRPLVVIDAGHGGKDPGACANGYREKVIALQIAKKLASQIRANGMDAKLTRSGDTYLRLRKRTSLANQWDADAFVSVHLNALPKGRHAKGVEIYLMALPSDKDAMELAKIENRELAEDEKSSDGKNSLLLSILGDMQQNNKIKESTLFAESIFKAGKKGGLPMRRVAQAPFFVLRGAGMPAILIETGFISERSEARLLASSSYQDKLAKFLAKGIADYLR